MSGTMPDEATLRRAVVEAVRRLDALGLNRGSTGNVSARWQGGFLITPTGMGSEVEPEDLAWVSEHTGEEGREGCRFEGRWQPSSEWHFHGAAYRARPDLMAVVHTHSPHATALACLRRPLPAFHYMVAVAGGHDVPLVPYHTFGTEALSQAVGQALRDRLACILANHGLVAAGTSVAQAMKVVVEIESLCGIYLQALGGGEPALLSSAQMDEVLLKFKAYGRQQQR